MISFTMDHLRFLSRKHGVELRSKPLCWNVVLTQFPYWVGGRPPVLSIDEGLDEGHATIGAMIMFACLELGWSEPSLRFRFPIPDDGPGGRRSAHQSRRDFRVPLKQALAILMPDEDLEQLARGEIEEEEYVWNLRIPWEFYERRVMQFRAQRIGLAQFA